MMLRGRNVNFDPSGLGSRPIRSTSKSNLLISYNSCRRVLPSDGRPFETNFHEENGCHQSIADLFQSAQSGSLLCRYDI